MTTRPPADRLLLLTAALAAACGGAPADSEEARAAREAMLFTVASQFREPPAALGVLDFAAVEWKDGCLEIRRRGPCSAERVPGYRLRLSRRGETYEYRAPAASPTDVALAAAPDPALGAPALAWRWPSAPNGCQTVLISGDARPAVGWCDGPVAEVAWLEGLFSDAEWSYLHGRFAPFERAADGHELAFAGVGSDVASPAWQEAIDRWAALRWSELRAGRAGAAHGRALAYRRPLRARPGTCDVLEVTEYGVAYLGRSACDGGAGEPGRAAWLSDELWEEMAGWLNEWGVSTSEATGMQVFGRGGRIPDAEDLRELTEWTDRAMAHVAAAPNDAWPGAR